jgi:protein phosphatase PTC7
MPGVLHSRGKWINAFWSRKQAYVQGSRGSSTCLLAVLQDESLHVANLGDCSLFIIRNGEVVHQTTEMQHAFNWPMQLGTKQKDTPMKDAMEDTWKVEKHDVVVMGSDGLTDNLVSLRMMRPS